LFSQPLSKGLHRTRPDIVEAPFFGDPRWVTQRLARTTDPPRPG
jgi:hypothetical protein